MNTRKRPTVFVAGHGHVEIRTVGEHAKREHLNEQVVRYRFDQGRLRGLRTGNGTRLIFCPASPVRAED